MFDFIKKWSRVQCPIGDSRIRLEHFFVLGSSFSNMKKICKNRRLLLPNEKDFPIKYDGSLQSAYETLKIIIPQINSFHFSEENFKLSFYKRNPPRIKEGKKVFTPMYDIKGNKIYPAAVLLGKKDNIFHICLASSQLRKPERLVATLTYELDYIKALFQYNIEREKIQSTSTELQSLFYGLGIFMANAPFQIYKNDQSWGGYKIQGHLKKDDWGYALALYAFIRNEYKPDWIKYLIPEVKRYFKLSEKFIWQNKDRIFKESYQPKGQSDEN